MFRFRRLRTKLTVLYASLFASVLLVMTGVVYSAIANNVGHVVRGELAASGTVFDRIWALRTNQLENGAGLLSRDFGFRSAIATHDAATIQSALDNQMTRLGADTAFLIAPDGAVTPVGDPGPVQRLSPATLAGLQSDGATAGVMMFDGAPYQAVSAPVMAPMPMGWVVFASKLDRGQLRSLESLSAIPLDASIVYRAAGGGWRDPAEGAASDSNAPLNAFVDAALKQAAPGPMPMSHGGERGIGLAKPLQSLDPNVPAVLLLRYPLARAMAPYQLMLGAMLLIGFGGIALLVFGSWALAKDVTRPLSALEDAAHRLQEGEQVLVGVDASDEIGRLAGRFNEMAAEIQSREQRITHLALHDADTDLPNRQSLEREIAALTRDAGEDHVFVAALGVDRFSHVRGAIGHTLFATLMGELGARIGLSEPQMRVARLSSATLAIAFTAADPGAALAKAEQVAKMLEAPLRLGENTVDVSLTAGLSGCAEDGSGVSSVIDRATIAVDQARDSRRRSAVFDAVAYGDPAANLSLMSEMRSSIEQGHMLLHHQPKFDLRQRAVVGCEALVRWTHPTRGLLAPDLFIGMAEETGHIRALTEWVLSQAIADQRAMAVVGRKIAVSVNISGRLLSDPEFAEVALALVEGADGEICFEITETAVIENPELALAIIDRFARAGVKVSIDDYGTGLSSLAYLKQIKANELKIDKSFIMALNESQRDALLVRSTIDLAHSLGLQVTAEGVETETSLALLSGMGCDLAQGYLIARPMPMGQFLGFLKSEPDAAMQAEPMPKPRVA